MKVLNFLACLFCILYLNTYSQGQSTIVNEEPFVLGQTIEINSKVLSENRKLNIYLPTGYDTSKTGYPVIYLLDGSADEDFIHIAGIVQFATFPWIEMIPKSIVVGIANTDRTRDMTYPTTIEKDIEDIPNAGGSANFLSFLETELQPFVDQQYRTTGTTTLIGQSLGGLLATEVLFKKPELFDNYIIISPSMWWDNESLLEFEPAFAKLDSVDRKKIYLGVGNEGDIMKGGAERLRDYLKNYPVQLKLQHQYFEKQNHGDVLHLAVYDAFGWMFEKEE